MLFSKPQVKDATTLVVESTDLRLLVTKSGRVTKWTSIPLPLGLVHDGQIAEPLEFGQIVAQAFDAEELERKRVISSLSGLRSIPRLLTMPKLQASLMEQAIAREARKEMPLSLDNLYMSWQSIPTANADQQTIYMLGIPRELIDGQVKGLEAAGIAPYVMDLKPLALIRAVNQPEAIIVNLEQSSLDIVLVVDCLPAIMRCFSLDQSEPDLNAKLDRLLAELTQTVRFYNDSRRGATLKHSTPVQVSGRLLASREAIDYMQNALDRPVTRPTPALTYPDDLPAADYMTNMGLALKKV